MTTSSVPSPQNRGADLRSVDDVFADIPPVQSADDLARDGIVDDADLDEFLADLRALRHTGGQ